MISVQQSHTLDIMTKKTRKTDCGG